VKNEEEKKKNQNYEDFRMVSKSLMMYQGEKNEKTRTPTNQWYQRNRIQVKN